MTERQPHEQLTTAELLEVSARYWAVEHARLWVAQLVLAAEICPDLIHGALAKVFDLSATKAVMDRADHEARESLAEAQRIASEVRILGEDIHKQLEELERQIEYLHGRLTEAARLAARLKNHITEPTNGQRTGGTT